MTGAVVSTTVMMELLVVTAPELSIVLPVFNEGEAVVPVLRALSVSVRTGHEIVVVYDFDGDTTVPVIDTTTPAAAPGVQDADDNGDAEDTGIADAVAALGLKTMSLQELKAKSPADLLALAEKLEIENANSMRKQDMMFAILKTVAEEAVEISGSGTLLTYPLLLASGLPPVVANGTNSFGVAPDENAPDTGEATEPKEAAGPIECQSCFGCMHGRRRRGHHQLPQRRRSTGKAGLPRRTS